MQIRRTELAVRRRVCGFSQESLAAVLEVDRTTVARWEAGISAPLPWVRTKLADALGVTADELSDLLDEIPTSAPDSRTEVSTGMSGSGLIATAAPWTLDSGPTLVESTAGDPAFDRRDFLVLSAGTAVGIAHDRLAVDPTLAVATGEAPATVLADAPQIDQVEHFHRLRLALIESDNLHGASSVIPLTEQSIERIGQLRRAGIGEPTATQRMRILYAEFAAWLHQDRRAWERAQHWTDRALTWSHQLGDDYSIAAILIRKAHIANDHGDGNEAVELAEAAGRAAPPGTRLGAVAAAFAGHGAALAGDRATSERSFDRARDLAEDADTDPSYGFFLDQSYIDVHQAHGRVALGDHRLAVDQFGQAISGMRSGFTRDQAVYVARQAVAYAKAGEFEPAARLGRTAMQVGVSTGSDRILTHVRTLDGIFDPRTAQTDVAAFRDSGKRWAVLAS